MENKLKGVGVVVEYNPFHNGHKIHCKAARKEGDVVIAVMSGDYVQRGEPACLNRWDRAEIALASGIDLIIELPVFYSTQSAEIFARGAIGILEKLNIEKIVFGSETADLEKLLERAKLEEDIVFKLEIRKNLKEGSSYATAYSKALEKIGFENNKSNDILGVEYLKAINYWKSSMIPIPIKREKVGYYEENIVDKITSATNIRKKISQGEEYRNLVPEIAFEKIEDRVIKNKKIAMLEDYFFLIRYRILMERNNLTKIQDIENGFENKLYESALNNKNYNSFFNSILSKRFTIGKIQRILIHILLGITKEDTKIIKETIPYIRVLGFSEKGQKYLKQLKEEKEDLIIFTSLKNIKKKLNEISLKFIELNENASKIYSMVNDYEEKKIPLMLK